MGREAPVVSGRFPVLPCARNQVSKANAAGGSQLEATVVGFHWAFGASAILMLVACTVMLVLLRKRHVARIEEQAASGEPVMLAA